MTASPPTRSPDDPLLPVLAAALDQTMAAACITTADLDHPGPEIVYVNAAYCHMTGHDAVDVLGQTPRLMQGPLTNRAVLDRLRSDLEAGRPFIGETVNYRDDGTPFLISWRIDPVLDGAGTVTHYVATQEDITRLRRAENLLAAEQAIDGTVTEVLARPGDVATNLTALADGIASAIADLIDHPGVEVAATVTIGTERLPLQGGQPAAAPDDPAEPPPDRETVRCALGPAGEGISGDIVVHGISSAQSAFLDRAGLDRAVDRARQALASLVEYERQRRAAIELQRGLLPASTPAAPGLELSSRYHPGALASRVGGDWYDVVTVDDRVVLVVGDLAGSGLRAAADMGRVRLMTRLLLQQGRSMADTLVQLDRFCEEEDLMATLIAVEIDGARRSAAVVSAGHPPPVLRRGTRTELVSVEPGPPLGFGSRPAVVATTVAIDPDTLVVLFTDGLVERRDEPIDESMAALADHVAADRGQVLGLADRLVARRLATTAEDDTDDIAVLTFRPSP